MPKPWAIRLTWKRVLYVLGLSAVVLWLAHSCALLPTSRLAPRAFVLNRDYRDMRRIFQIPKLPPSFRIEKVRHPGIDWFPAPDGPLPIHYLASIDQQDYHSLISQTSGSATRMKNGFDFRRGSAMQYFEKQLADEVFLHSWEENAWAPVIMESWTTKTVDGRQYPRRSGIVVDDRSSEPLRLYITTIVPYED